MLSIAIIFKRLYRSIMLVTALSLIALPAYSQGSISQLKFIDEFTVPYNQNFKSTTIGGLSGIDYDQVHDIYYVLSDDRSDINPVRFYIAKISISPKGIDTVLFLDVHQLLQANGKVYRSFKLYPDQAVDPEDIRFNPKTNELYWSSEGERIIKGETVILTKPFIQKAQTNGNYSGKFSLPPLLTMQNFEKGPRRNGTIEAISFTKNYDTLFAALEEPLFEDGPRADITPTKSWIRIFQFDVASQKNTAQFAYLIEPVAYPATPQNEFKVNGVSEIVWFRKDKLLVVERSYSTGRLPCTIKVYLADLSQADDIKRTQSLTTHPPVKPVKKQLLVNMDDLGIYIDNVEGATYGPKLPNGHQTLIFVTDDNFGQIQKTQFLLFEIIP